MLNPMRDTLIKARTGGGKGRHLCPRFVQTFGEGKTSHELGWNVNAMINRNKRVV